MTSALKESGKGEDLQICHVFADSIVFKQYIYCLSLQIESVEGLTKLVFCLHIINV